MCCSMFRLSFWAASSDLCSSPSCCSALLLSSLICCSAVTLNCLSLSSCCRRLLISVANASRELRSSLWACSTCRSAACLARSDVCFSSRSLWRSRRSCSSSLLLAETKPTLFAAANSDNETKSINNIYIYIYYNNDDINNNNHK